MEQHNLNDLIAKAQRGDSKAYSQIFEEFWSYVYYRCYKYLHDDVEAEDAAQEVFLVLYRRLPDLKKPQFFQKNLKWLTSEVCRDYRQKRRRTADPDLVLDLEDVEDRLTEEKEEFLPVAVLEQKELKQQVLQLVDQLPDKQKEAVLLYYFDGFSQKEIASLTKSRGSAVRDRIYNAKKALKEEMEMLMEQGQLKFAGLPILTQILQEEMQTVAQPLVKDTIWTGLAQKIPALQAAGTASPTSITSADGANISRETIGSSNCSAGIPASTGGGISGFQVAVTTAASVAVVCGGIIGVNLYEDFGTVQVVGSELAQPVVTQEYTDHILSDLENVSSLDSLTAFVTQYQLQEEGGVTSGGGTDYVMYSLNRDDMVLVVGYLLTNDSFQKAYEVREPASQIPGDVKNWVLQNLR